MKIQAIHEIVYFDRERKTIAPGQVVDLDPEIVKHIPEAAYTKAGSGSMLSGTEIDQHVPEADAPKLDLNKANKPQLIELATSMGLEADDSMTKAVLVELIKKAQTPAQPDDDLV